MDVIVTDQIRNRELDGEITEEVFKVLSKVKRAADIAEPLSAPGLPPGTALRKVYATSQGGPRRLLFFFKPHSKPEAPATGRSMAKRRNAPSASTTAAKPEPWYLLLYRAKDDPVGENMSPKNTAFVAATIKRLTQAIDDLESSTPENQKFIRI